MRYGFTAHARYLPLQVAGLRIGSSRLTIDVRDDDWHLTGLEEAGIELIRQPLPQFAHCDVTSHGAGRT